MVRKITTLLLIGGALAIAACNTVRGAGADVSSAANCTENAMHGGKC
jgi:predicted small secreted protein